MTDQDIVTVQSCSGGEYVVNVREYSCSCPDWRNTRTAFKKGSPYRLCKHLVGLVCQRGMAEQFPDVPLTELAAQSKGVPLPKPKEGDYLRGYFGCELREDVHERFKFVFGGGANVMTNFIRFQEITVDGPALDCTGRRTPLWGAYNRLVWVGLAEFANDIPSEEFFSFLGLQDLRDLGASLGLQFGQRRTGIRQLVEAVPDWRKLQLPVDVFRLRPLTMEDFLTPEEREAGSNP